MKTGHDTPAQPGSAWYHQPIVWLGILVFAASVAGCIWLIVVGVRYADTPLDTANTVLGVPAGSRSSATPPPPPTDPPQ